MITIWVYTIKDCFMFTDCFIHNNSTEDTYELHKDGALVAIFPKRNLTAIKIEREK